MMIGNIGKMQYNIMLERLRRQMQEGKKVKPVAPTDNQGEMNREQIPKKKNNEKQSK